MRFSSLLLKPGGQDGREVYVLKDANAAMDHQSFSDRVVALGGSRPPGFLSMTTSTKLESLAKELWIKKTPLDQPVDQVARG